MVQFEIDSFTTGAGGAGVVSGVFQLSGIYQLSGGIVIVSGLFQLSGAGGGAGTGLAGSNFLGSGNSSTTTYFLSHGLGVVPSTIAIAAGSPLARGTVDVSGNLSGITVTYPVAPSSGDIKLYWIAGPSSLATSGIYQISGEYAFDFTKQISGLYVTHSGGLYQPSGTAGGGGVSGFAQASGLYVEHSGGLYQPSGVYVGQSGGLYQASGIFQPSGVFQTSGIYQSSGVFQTSGIYLLTSGGLYQVSGIYPTSGLFALSGTGGGVFSGGGTSGFIHAATFLGSGNNSNLLYTISHGLGQVPTGISVDAASPQARGDIDLSGNASGIFVTYTSPPLSGDVRLSWVAGPSASAGGGGIISGLFALSGATGAGGVSGVVHAATFLGSGDNLTTLYTLSHGLGIAPIGISVEPSSPAARGSFDVSGDTSSIYVRYPVAPVSGDVKLSWIAGPTDAANIVTIGSGTVHAATFVGSGNASTVVYTLSHGIGTAPQGLVVSPMSPQARGDFDVSGNASGIFVTYPIAPASGDVRLSWLAGPSSLASISGSLLHAGLFAGSGNNVTTLYTLSHGLGTVPSTILVNEASPQARGLYDVSGNASGLFVTYTSPPASGDVRLYWQAGPSSIAVLNAQSGIYTITSGSNIGGDISGSPNFQGAVTFSGTTNIPSLLPRPTPFLTIFRSGSNYISQKYDGTILANVSGKPGQVLQTTLAEVSGAIQSQSYARAEVYVCDGDYNVESGFQGADVLNMTNLTMGRRAVWDMPLGHSGGYFLRLDDVSRSRIAGGYVREAASPAESGIGLNWIAVKVESTTTAANVYNVIEDMWISRARAGVQFFGHGNGIITSTLVKGVNMEHCKYFVDFDVSGDLHDPAGTLGQNTFEDMYLQSNGFTQIGIRNIKGKREEFRNVTVWDTHLGASGDGAVATLVHSGASDTMIQAGLMTSNIAISAGPFAGQTTYQDYGSGTKVFDAFSNLSVPRADIGQTYTQIIETSGTGQTLTMRNLASGQPMVAHLIPGSGGSNSQYSLWGDRGQQTRFQLRKSVNNVFLTSIRQLSGGANSAINLEIQDVANSTLIQGISISTSGNVLFNVSGGTVQFFSGNTSQTNTITAANSGAFAPLGYITARLGTASIKIPYFSP